MQIVDKLDPSIRIQQQFLCGIPLKDFNWFDLLQNDNLQKILDLTINSQLINDYPVKVDYQKVFLKYLLNHFERQETIIDCLYDAYGRIVAQPDGTFAYKHYLNLQSGKVISLKENTQIISEGTTGLCTWQASIVLSEWILQNPHEFSPDCHVLELGAGIGLTGLTLTQNIQIHRYLFTDCHSTVLSLLNHNVHLNRSEDINCQIEISDLDWDRIDGEKCEKIGCIDQILGADIVYDRTLFAGLRNTIRSLFQYCQARTFLLACTERNTETLKEFLELLETSSFKVESISIPAQIFYIWSCTIPLKLYRITPNIV